jgi:hypothetical protein
VGLRVEGMGIEEVMVFLLCSCLVCFDSGLVGTVLVWYGRVATSASKVGML